MQVSKKGFTLVEMLVVIAIIAVLVSIILPRVVTLSSRAQAAADAANLRSIVESMNVELLDSTPFQDVIKHVDPLESKSIPGAMLQVVYTQPCFVDVYFVEGSSYYGIRYLSQLAENGTSDYPLARPIGLGDFYEVGTGNKIN